MLPYWVHTIGHATDGVMDAIYAVNTSRVCTATADSLFWADYLPDGEPNGDPIRKSGVSHDVIHFNATMAVRMGYQYWAAFQQALRLTHVVSSAKTAACGNSSEIATKQNSVAVCGEGGSSIDDPIVE
jgi:hypothetical protein